MGLGGPEQLVLLPDSDSGSRLAEALSLDVLMRYVSGRPLAVGRCYEGRTWSYGTSEHGLLAIGSLPLRAPQSALEWLERGLSADALDSMQIPGSFTLLARSRGRMRVQGTISGIRKIFWCRIGGETFAATDAAILAALGRFTPNVEALARWLVTPHAPYNFANATAWHGVSVVPPGMYLATQNDGEVETRFYWRGPAPSSDPIDSAADLQKRLAEAVAVRTAAPTPLTCDASGGIDSSAVLALAVQSRSDTVAFTTGPQETLASDISHAAEAVDFSRPRDWFTSGPDGFPHVFDSMNQLLIPADEPFAGEAVKMRSRYIARELSARYPSSRVTHLTGHLGDEIFASGIAHLRDIGHQRSSQLRPRINAINARTRIPKSLLWRWALASRSYSATYKEYLECGKMPVGWHSYPLEMPHWVTSAAHLNITRSPGRNDKVGQSGRTAEQHETLSRIAASGDLLRHEAKIMSEYGVFLEIPLGDDRVIDAALRSPIGTLQDPRYLKPVLLRAVGSLIPQSIVTRTSKVDNTRAIWTGMNRNRTRIDDVTTSMLLEDAGLIDGEAFRQVLHPPHPPQLAPMALWRTLSVETWLRDREGLRPVIARGDLFSAMTE